MTNFLNKPYPLIIAEGRTKSNIINLVAGVFVTLILYFAPPTFFLGNSLSYTFSLCLFFGLITTLICFFYTHIITRIFYNYFLESKWTIGREIIFMSALIVTIASINYLVAIFVYFPNEPFTIIGFAKSLLTTIMIGVVPIVGAILVTAYFKQKSAKEGADKINIKLNRLSKSTNKKTITINGNGKYETLMVNSIDVLFIESSGNYCDIFYTDHKEIKKETFRISLANISSQLNHLNHFVKTHRSYIVNHNKIIKSEGNAQGYQLTIEGFDDKTIPVSRANIKTIDELYQ